LKKFIAGIIAGVTLAASGVGVAATQFVWTKHYRGVLCAAKQGNVICMKESGRGYAVGINRDFVTIMRSSKPVVIKWH